MISKEEVEHIAKLARLQLTEEEVKKMQHDLSSILDYFNILKKAPKPTVKKGKGEVSLVENVTRKDEVVQNPASIANNLVQAAPDKQDGYVKVKAVL